MLTFSLCVVTTSRNAESDKVASALESYLNQAGAKLSQVILCKDKTEEIQHSLKLLSEHSAPIIIFSGGTGLTSDDVTPESLEPMYSRKLPGFDEAMRMANFAKIPGTILSRGVSGIYKGKIVLSMPGSPKAVVENLAVIYSVLGHAVLKVQDDKVSCV